MLEAHCGVPLDGAVLVALDTRPIAADFACILDRSEAVVVIVDATCRAALTEALRRTDARRA